MELRRSCKKTREQPIEMMEKATKDFIQGNIFLRDKTPTHCYGTIEFKKTMRTTKGKFVRFSADTDPATIFQLMTKHWKVEPPRFLLSVAGGAMSLAISSKLQKEFSEGIRKVSNTPGTWIVTGGTNAGVMKMVGDANRGTNNTVVAVTSWESIANKDSLVPKNHVPPSKEIIDATEGGTSGGGSGGTFPYDLGSYLVLDDNLSHLNQHHSHFLLVDDEKKWAGEVQFRKNLEEYIVRKSDPNGLPIPTVMLVLQGGPRTLHKVLHAVENDIPCVLVKGSGGTADLLANGITYNEKKMQEEGRENVRRLKSTMNEDQLNEYYDIFERCLKLHHTKRILKVVDQDTGFDIEKIILDVILSSKEIALSDYEKLRLTLMWNRADLAESQILSPMKKWTNKHAEKGSETELVLLMIVALAMNCCDFVKLLTNYGVSLENVLDRETLEFLYAFRRYPTSTLQWDDDEVDTLDSADPNKKAWFESIYSFSDHSDKTAPRRIDLEHVRKRLCSFFTNIPDDEISDVIELPHHGTDKLERPYQQLFFWAVFNNMLDMALFLLQFLEEGLAATLIASAITDGLIDLSDGEPELLEEGVEDTLDKSKGTYTRLSIDLMDTIYKIDEKSTQLLVRKEQKLFNMSYSSLDFAYATGQQDIVAHRAVQDILQEVWSGSLKKGYSNFHVLAAIVLPVLLHWMDVGPKYNISYEDEPSILPSRHKGSQKRSENRGNKSPTIIKKFYYFHVESPMVRFVTHYFAYGLFILLFSYVVLTKHNKLTKIELYLAAVVTGYTVNEIYQFAHSEAKSKWDKLRDYFSSFWNKVDVVAIVSFYFAFILRTQSHNTENNFGQIGHIVYAIDLSIWIVRVMQFFEDDPLWGPYVDMILKMFNDMMNFLVILIVFLASYGITMRAILVEEPNSSQGMLTAALKPFLVVFGEYFMEDRTNTTTYFGTDMANGRVGEWVALVYLVVYLVIVNILILNVLIAIFNSTYENVMENSSRSWKFNRYMFLLDYAQQRTFLIPPLSLIFHFLCVVMRILCFFPCVKRRIEQKDRLLEGSFCDIVHHPSFCWQLQRHKEHGFRVKMNTNGNQEREEEISELESGAMISVLRKLKRETQSVVMKSEG